MEECARENLECYKQSLTGSSGENSGDQNDERNVDCKGYADKVSDRNEDSLGLLLAKTKLDALCPCLETLWEDELRGDRLVYPAEEILRQESTQAATCIITDCF